MLKNVHCVHESCTVNKSQCAWITDTVIWSLSMNHQCCKMLTLSMNHRNLRLVNMRFHSWFGKWKQQSSAKSYSKYNDAVWFILCKVISTKILHCNRWTAWVLPELLKVAKPKFWFCQFQEFYDNSTSSSVSKQKWTNMLYIHMSKIAFFPFCKLFQSSNKGVLVIIQR